VSGFLSGIAIFTLAYPSMMAMVWICGGLYYYFQWERRDIALARTGLALPRYPKVTLMVPCYNEGANVEETISHLLRQRYPDFMRALPCCTSTIRARPWRSTMVSNGRRGRYWWA